MRWAKLNTMKRYPPLFHLLLFLNFSIFVIIVLKHSEWPTAGLLGKNMCSISTINKVGCWFALLLSYVYLLPSVHAQVQNTTFVPVAPEKLSSTFVRCIYKDSRGYMWFGTGTGLVRYDGTTIYRYEHTPENKNTITDNRINAIIEDASNNLWIGTGQGLVIYNAEKDNFSNVNEIAGNTNRLSNQYITALCYDRMGRIWIGTLGHGLNVYDPKTFTFAYLTDNNTTHNKFLSANYITSLFRFEDTVWAGTKGGLKVYDTRDMSRSPLPMDMDKSVTSKEITQVTRDATGNMWLATVDREIIKLTREGKYYHVHKTILRPNVLAEAEGNILTLSIDAKGNVWIGGENAGLNYLDVKTDQIIRYEAWDGYPGKLPTKSVRSVYVDNTGITWIGTYNRGAFLVDNRAKKFESYQRTIFTTTGTAGNNVKDVAEDKDGIIWIASDGGLAKLDSIRNELQYPEEINNKLGTRYLSALLFDTKGNLWMGTWGKGVYKLNLKSHEMTNYKLESNGFGDNKVFCLYEDSRQNIWVGSVGSGLFCFDQQSSNFVPLNEEKKADYVKKSSYVSSILEDADSSLWIGTLFGLYRLSLNHEHVYDVTLYSKSDQPGSVSSYDIQTIYSDPKGNFWFGSGDNGIAVLPDRSSAFKKIQKKNGLASNTIRGILTDATGKMWISSNMGLSRYDPITNSFRNYTREDGLASNEFNAGACLQARDGKLYFGSDKGLVAFYPDSIRNNPIKPVVYFTDLKLNNQSVQTGMEGSPLKKHISLTGDIQLPYSQRSFAIDFVAINYGQSSRNQYCYKLEGFDDNWNCVGSSTSAVYTNIDPGNYVFLVKASNSDGVSSEVPAQLDITIRQAPWKSWWAFMLYAFLPTSFIFFLVRIRIERIKIKNQLEFERLAREKEHALSESKTQFFTNISHEFRTPLSLITMPLENLIAMNELPSTVKERLSTIRVSADKMNRLVNELMDFNKLENAKLKLCVQQGEMVQFINDITSVFHDLAAKRNMHYGIHSMVRSLQGWFDHDKLEKILVNVLSNAFKFTADNGQINVIISARDIIGKDPGKIRCLELVIVDNGIGISAEELPFIFDKFYQAKSSALIANPGTGIGLSLTKGLVELHHGSIHVESTPDRETKFVILLPIDRQAYSDDDICETPGYIVAPDTTLHVNPNNSSVNISTVDEDHDKPQILIVEDNDELRKYISIELRPLFTVLEAKNGKEGLEMAFESTPDLIISDILMPIKSGIELCQDIKSNLKTSHIPFILLTAKTTVDDQVTGIATGADVYITKPFSIRVLMTHVNQIIDSRQKLYSRFSQDVYLLPSKVATNEIDQAFLQKAIDHIIENIQDSQLGVDSIATLFNLSRMQVYRKIKALTGKSIVEFIRMVRIKQALKLMDTHKYTLSEIAYQSGFNSSSYFTRVFKETYGKTPSEYLENAGMN
jgi:ligand-binding sensor domain-containing protein/signal transduction histidine kinase/DNA-binding response OmpR family regulator